MAGQCTFCEAKIDSAQDYRRVVGWEKRRNQGGTNALRGREVQDIWACRFCVDKIASGVSPAQEGLAF